ncbi:MAG: hypothetical protein V8S95_02480 [Odoribacter sp.]
MPDRFEIEQIVRQPHISDAEKERVRERPREYWEQLLKKEKNHLILWLCSILKILNLRVQGK